MRHTKKGKPIHGGKVGTDTTCESNQMSDLIDKDLKVAIINLLKKPKKKKKSCLKN